MTTLSNKPQLEIDDSFDALFPPRAHTVPAPGWVILHDGPRSCASHVATKVASWHTTQDAAIQATWDTHIAPGALVCRVCAQRGVDAGAQYLICDHCRADLSVARRVAERRFKAAVREMEVEQAAWEDYQAQLPDDVAAKWQQVEQQRKDLEHALNAALRGPRTATETNEQRQALIQQARAAHDAFMAKVERTRNAPQHMLYAVLQRQAQYDAALRAAVEQTRTATEALQELDAAEGAAR
jgi:hypothetical protein